MNEMDYRANLAEEIVKGISYENHVVAWEVETGKRLGTPAFNGMSPEDKEAVLRDMFFASLPEEIEDAIQVLQDVAFNRRARASMRDLVSVVEKNR